MGNLRDGGGDSARGAKGPLSIVLNSGWDHRVLGELGLRLKGLERHVFLMRENSGWDGRLVLLAYSDKSPCLWDLDMRVRRS